MSRQGIRISRLLERLHEVTLKDLIIEFNVKNSIYWMILYLDAAGKLRAGISLTDFQNLINNSENGLPISQNDLLNLSQDLEQIYDVVLIGDKDPLLLHRYEDEQEMYETCEIVIVMFDSAYWEIFANDNAIILKIANKIGNVEFINSDFLR